MIEGGIVRSSLAAHNGLVGGSNPPGPTTLKFRTLIFQFFLAKLSNQTASLTVAVHYLDLSIAARASRAWSADLVYRCTSLKLAWPVIAAISCMVHPASARRRAAALRSP